MFYSAIVRAMKAASNKTYGPPSVIKIVDIPIPQPTNNQLLIKVRYSSINRTDCGFLRASPFVIRFFSGLRRPKYTTLGCEFSGIVEEVGSEVKDFSVGDKVFGFDDVNFGSYAEYKTIREDGAVDRVPENISLKQAAVSTEGAHYALFYLYKIQNPDKTKVFVNGATGAIGSAAVQMLAAKGFYVEASSTTKEVAMVKQLGAQKVVDWQKQDISAHATQCDVYFDSVGKSSFKEARKILKPGGLYMSSELGKFGQNPLLSLINPVQRLFTKTNIQFPLPKTRKKEVKIVSKFIEDGEFTPVIDREYQLEDIIEGFSYVETGQKVGNVVVKVIG